MLNQKIRLKFVRKSKNIKITRGIWTHDIHICSESSNPLRYAVWWQDCVKETIHKTLLNFIVYFDE